jgi:hypothetical protein
MTITNEELGRLVREFDDNQRRIARLKALLAQTSENMDLLAKKLKTEPETIIVTEASIAMRDEHGNERTVPLSTLEIGNICRTLTQLQEAIDLNARTREELELAGYGRIARALENQRPPAPNP